MDGIGRDDIDGRGYFSKSWDKGRMDGSRRGGEGRWMLPGMTMPISITGALSSRTRAEICIRKYHRDRNKRDFWLGSWNGGAFRRRCDTPNHTHANVAVVVVAQTTHTPYTKIANQLSRPFQAKNFPFCCAVPMQAFHPNERTIEPERMPCFFTSLQIWTTAR